MRSPHFLLFICIALFISFSQSQSFSNEELQSAEWFIQTYGIPNLNGVSSQELFCTVAATCQTINNQEYVISIDLHITYQQTYQNPPYLTTLSFPQLKSLNITTQANSNFAGNILSMLTGLPALETIYIQNDNNLIIPTDFPNQLVSLIAVTLKDCPLVTTLPYNLLDSSIQQLTILGQPGLSTIETPTSSFSATNLSIGVATSTTTIPTQYYNLVNLYIETYQTSTISISSAGVQNIKVSNYATYSDSFTFNSLSNLVSVELNGITNDLLPDLNGYNYLTQVSLNFKSNTQYIGSLQSLVPSSLVSLAITGLGSSSGLPDFFQYAGGLKSIDISNSAFFGTVPTSFCKLNYFNYVSTSLSNLPSCLGCYVDYFPAHTSPVTKLISNGYIPTISNASCAPSITSRTLYDIRSYGYNLPITGSNLGFAFQGDSDANITMYVPTTSLSYLVSNQTARSASVVLSAHRNSIVNIEWLDSTLTPGPVPTTAKQIPNGVRFNVSLIYDYVSPHNVLTLSVSDVGVSCPINTQLSGTTYLVCDTTNALASGNHNILVSSQYNHITITGIPFTVNYPIISNTSQIGTGGGLLTITGDFGASQPTSINLYTSDYATSYGCAFNSYVNNSIHIISCQLSTIPSPGVFKLRLFADGYSTTYDLTVYNQEYITCVKQTTCQQHGVCSISNGNCQCNLHYFGPSCGTYYPLISSVQPSNLMSNGGLVTIQGQFGNTSIKVPKVTLVDLDCPMFTYNSTTIQCTFSNGIPYGNLSLQVTVSDGVEGGSTLSVNTTISIGNYPLLHCIETTSNCSGHGVCSPTLGTCTCNHGYNGTMCQYEYPVLTGANIDGDNETGGLVTLVGTFPSGSALSDYTITINGLTCANRFIGIGVLQCQLTGPTTSGNASIHLDYNGLIVDNNTLLNIPIPTPTTTTTTTTTTDSTSTSANSTSTATTTTTSSSTTATATATTTSTTTATSNPTTDSTSTTTATSNPTTDSTSTSTATSNPTTTTTTSSSSTESTPSNNNNDTGDSKKKSNTGTVVGAVVGSIAAVAIGLGAALFVKHRLERKKLDGRIEKQLHAINSKKFIQSF